MKLFALIITCVLYTLFSFSAKPASASEKDPLFKGLFAMKVCAGGENALCFHFSKGREGKRISHGIFIGKNGRIVRKRLVDEKKFNELTGEFALITDLGEATSRSTATSCPGSLFFQRFDGESETRRGRLCPSQMRGDVRGKLAEWQKKVLNL
jgi:hypothetical protein